MTIRFLGNTSCVPDPGTDTSCLLVNDRLLFDTGWAPVLRMRDLGLDPLEICGVLFSHFHQDHYLGLVQILFMLGLRVPKERDDPRRSPLIAGPREHLGEVVRAGQDYLRWSRFPELALRPDLHPLAPGDSLTAEGLAIEVSAARHLSGFGSAEPALAYRVTESGAAASFFFSGDTHPYPELAEAAKGVAILIHDSAHSTPEQAAEVARNAGVGQLILTHISGTQVDEFLPRARALFPATEVAGPNMMLTLPAGVQ